MSRTYDFYLREGNRYNYDAVISLPSVTTIVSAVLAKPQLVDWTYRQTIDAISGAIGVLKPGEDTPLEDFADTFSDPEMLDEWLKKSKMHYKDVSDEAAERGDKAHKTLSMLSDIYGAGGRDTALKHAERALKSKDPYSQGVARWWINANPAPEMHEHVVMSLKHGYAGRFDFYGNVGNAMSLIDLKTRRSDLDMYTSDQVQLCLYDEALRERTQHRPSEKLVLLANEKGEYKVSKVWVPQAEALAVVRLYYALRKTDPRMERS